MFRRICSLLAASAVVGSMAHPAFADNGATEPAAPASEEARAPEVAYAPAPASPAPAKTTQWYGWQTMLADGVSLGTIPLELSSASPSASYLFIGSLSGYALGAPAIHAAHGRWRLAAADLGLRVGAVTVGGLLGSAFGKPTTAAACDAKLAGCLADDSSGMFVGATIGAIAASLLDATLLARDSRPAESTPAPGFVWTPSAGMIRGGATAGVVGAF